MGHQSPRSQSTTDRQGQRTLTWEKPHCQGRHGIGLIIQAPYQATGSRHQPSQGMPAGSDALARDRGCRRGRRSLPPEGVGHNGRDQKSAPPERDAGPGCRSTIITIPPRRMVKSCAGRRSVACSPVHAHRSLNNHASTLAQRFGQPEPTIRAHGRRSSPAWGRGCARQPARCIGQQVGLQIDRIRHPGAVAMWVAWSSVSGITVDPNRSPAPPGSRPPSSLMPIDGHAGLLSQMYGHRPDPPCSSSSRAGCWA